MRHRLFSPIIGPRAALWLVARTGLTLLVWAFLVSTVTGMSYPPSPATGHSMMYHEPYEYLLPALAVQLVAEELFRLVPLALVVWLTRRNPHTRRYTLAMSVLTAILFGLMHLPNGIPLMMVLFCQAVLGLVWNHVYLRTGGLAGRMLVGFFYAWLAHFSYDVALVVMERTLT